MSGLITNLMAILYNYYCRVSFSRDKFNSVHKMAFVDSNVSVAFILNLFAWLTMKII